MKTSTRCHLLILALLASIVSSHIALAQSGTLGAAVASTDLEAPPATTSGVWTPKIDPTGWWMSEKYEGVRALWTGRKLLTRTGMEIVVPDYFLAEMPKGFVLEGDLWMGRGKFEETMSIVLSETPDERWKKVRFIVCDAPREKGVFEWRMRLVESLLPAANQFLKPLPEQHCKGMEHLLDERKRVAALDGEGLILRKPEAKGNVVDLPDVLQVKLLDEAEATVIAHVAGKGKLKGRLASMRVRTPEGREFFLDAGLTETQRQTPPDVGTVVSYRYLGLTEKKLPRAPSFVQERKD